MKIFAIVLLSLTLGACASSPRRVNCSSHPQPINAPVPVVKDTDGKPYPSAPSLLSSPVPTNGIGEESTVQQDGES